MKKTSIKVIAILFSASILWASCSKKKDEVQPAPTLPPESTMVMELSNPDNKGGRVAADTTGYSNWVVSAAVVWGWNR